MTQADVAASRHDTDPTRPIRSALLDRAADAGIRHGFFTRAGGVSSGIYRGLNVGVGSQDDRALVMENRRRVAAHFGQPLDRLATVHQVHSARAVTVGPDYDGDRPEADALVTATPGLVLGTLAADCGPILFADPKARVIGAAHAGWKGALDGVLEATVAAMEALGAARSDIVATLGPSISQANYEVGADYAERFVARDPAYGAFFAPSDRDGHLMFDLPGLTLLRLSRAGIRADNLALCTYADEDNFFSYRRTTHRREPDYGRQISAIMIKEH